MRYFIEHNPNQLGISLSQALHCLLRSSLARLTCPEHQNHPVHERGQNRSICNWENRRAVNDYQIRLCLKLLQQFPHAHQNQLPLPDWGAVSRW